MNDFSKIRRLFTEIVGALESQKLLNYLGLKQIHNIQGRTRKGIDLFGNPFQQYSDEYAEWKEKRGLPANVVNLTLHDIDGMMHQIDHVLSPDLKSVEIQILDPSKRKLASYHDQTGAGKSRVIRRFWGVSEEDQKGLGEIVEHDLELLLQRLSD